MIAITAQIESRFNAEDDLVLSVAIQSRRVRPHCKRRCRWVSVIGSTCNRCRDTRCPSARCLPMVWEDTEAHSEADQGRPETGRHVNDAFSVLCSHHLLSVKSEQPT
ncbi:hypothetical protein TNCV_2361911 [Trichonephila clavipes]|nr:hypothetical protein TNCV_2361911 [Trichonephila clavipes]